MIADITPDHYPQILKINENFVHWLSPMKEIELIKVLKIATYKKQIDEAQAILIGYAHDADYPDHWNLTWLRQKFDNFFYIDRIIVDENSHGQNYGKLLYDDIERFAREQGHPQLACEVNTIPDNPGSHKFHIKMGFQPCGEQIFETGEKAVRYYAKSLI